MDIITLLIIIVLVLLFFYLLYIFYKRNRKINEKIIKPKNHDHLKKCHNNKLSALNEISRIRNKNIKGSERMNAYFSESRQCWLVGKSSW